MLTRCPVCATHFRVTTGQLKARTGRVRCGECQNVFNALDTLIEEPMGVVVAPTPETLPQNLPASLPDTEADVVPAAPSDGITAPSAPTPEPTVEAEEELAALLPENQEAPVPEPVERVETETTELETALAETAEPELVEPETTEPETAEADADPLDWSETFPEPPPRRWPWIIGSLVAFTAIGLQAVLAFGVELAVLMPEAKPALVALCDVAGCEIGLPTKVALVGIEASDLHPDTEHRGRLALTATLKNRAPFAQQFPHLELTLTDTADKAIARKILAPADYLPPATALARGMQPNADLALAVGIDPGEMAASGYRLYLFYP